MPLIESTSIKDSLIIHVIQTLFLRERVYMVSQIKIKCGSLFELGHFPKGTFDPS